MPHATSGFTANELIIQAIATKGRTASDLQNDTALRTQLVDALTLIQFDYCGREDWNFTHNKGTIACSAGVSEYVVSSVEKYEIIYDKTNNRIVRPTSNKELTRGDPNEDWTSEGPYVYSRWGDQNIILQPIPNTSVTLNYRAKILPTPLTDHNSYLTVPFKFQSTILHGLKAWFYDITDDQRANNERQFFEEGILKDWEKDVFDLDEANRFISYEEWSQNPITNTYENYLARYFG